VLREPLLPADYFEIRKAELIAGYETTRTDPASLAPRLLAQTLSPYAKDDIRYMPTPEESIERLKATTHAQVVQLYRDYLSGREGELTIVGDFDAKASLPVLQQALNQWESKAPYARIISPLIGGITGTRQEIKTPDKANATYSAGLTMPLRDDDADYSALMLGNYILGGSTLSSRLGDRIRQKEGLSYGVTSSLFVSSWEHRATLTITAISNPTNMARLEVCAKDELQRLVRDGVTAEEMDRARMGLLETMKVSRSSDAAITSSLGALRHRGRTMQWTADLEQKLRALTPEAVNTALRARIDPAKLTVVVAGDFGKVIAE
jgi:zinc protease